MQEAARLVDVVYATADTVGMDKAARQAVILHIEKRDISAETILATIRHHAAREYFYLLRDSTPHSLAAIYANNVNDRFLAQHLQGTEALQTPQLQAALLTLTRHLEAIPPGKK